MAAIIQILVGGLCLGGIYALGALGLTVCFGVLNILNVAHGEFLMLGSFTCYFLFKLFGLSPFVSLVVVLIVFLPLGFIFEKLFIEPISNRSPHEMLISSTLVTFGLALAAEDIVAFLWGGSEAGVSYALPNFHFGDVTISTMRTAALVIIAALTVLFHLVLKNTYIGKALRAISQNRRGALVVGIDIRRISMITFGIGTCLAGVAGCVYASIYAFGPYIGMPLTVKFLAIIVLGGVGSFAGAFLGGIILGLTENLVALYVGLQWSPAVAFLLLMLILIARPEGLLGRRAG
jgi:branched-chain amino acid transport system permease protein